MSETASLSVRGSATQEIQPDFAFIAVEVSGRSPEQQTALSVARNTLETLRAGLAAARGVRRSEFSTVGVHEYSRWDEAVQANVAGGWLASVWGYVDAEVEAVGSLVAVVTEAGAQVSSLDWRLDADNPAQREVRRAAVADAARAAEDFATALGRSVGDLITLADPGLLGGQVVAVGRGLAGARSMAATGGHQADFEIDLDPRPVTVQAYVEARYKLAD